ncbi:MAG: ABC transporter permease [Clostridiales bacterium]|nr:ABC transporter permease [Clostridiales bacterium]
MNRNINPVRKVEQEFNVLRPLMAVLVAMVLCFIIILIASDEPMEALRLLLTGPLTTMRRFGNVLEAWIPFMFTGCAICILYSANVINMAAEGAFFLGGVATSAAAICITLPSGIHPIVAVLLGGVAGALVCLIPGLLEMKFDAKAVVSSLMLNYVCLYLGLYIIKFMLRDPQAGFIASWKFEPTAILPKLIDGTNVHVGLFIAVLAVIFSYLYLYKSRWGYCVRMIGKNPNFAKYSGIKVAWVVISSQMIGGFIAGIGGGVQLVGMYDRFQYQQLPQFGFDGILIATLAKLNPKYVPITGFFLAYIRTGAEIMARKTDVPYEIVLVVQALIIMMMAAQLFLQKWKHRRIVAASQRILEEQEV